MIKENQQQVVEAYLAGHNVNHVKLDEQNLKVDSVLFGLANFKTVLVISMIGKIEYSHKCN